MEPNKKRSPITIKPPAHPDIGSVVQYKNNPAAKIKAPDIRRRILTNLRACITISMFYNIMNYLYFKRYSSTTDKI